MKKIGDEGEIIAIKYLQKHGFVIKDTNFKFGRFGEVDIVAEKGSRYYFIEVKYRSHTLFGLPEDAIIARKLRKCLRTMQFYCKIHKVPLENIQFDVITILREISSHKITHYRNIEMY
ncbi:YraN family protein [Candidatus Gracilibacteria bacterium]|nr:YraN family protein [Candidatus Gracilibacteria bacterium]